MQIASVQEVSLTANQDAAEMRARRLRFSAAADTATAEVLGHLRSHECVCVCVCVCFCVFLCVCVRARVCTLFWRCALMRGSCVRGGAVWRRAPK
jgi:hypothetical protein